MRRLAIWILGLMGWKVTQDMPQGISKAVVVMAPHTSNWDFVYGRLGFAKWGITPRMMIKKEAFFFPLGVILRALGAFPIDRGFSTGTIKRVTALINESDSFFLLIAPEGTRKLAKNWKKGFYFVAQQAKVPIICGYLDYKTKTGGMGLMLYPTGDYDADLKKIQDFYKDKQAKHPEKFSLSPQNLKKNQG